MPAFDSRQAIEIVERNLGGSIAEKFESFGPQPIAAASLGQVRLASSLPLGSLEHQSPQGFGIPRSQRMGQR